MILVPDVQEEAGDFSLVINALEILSKTPKNTKIHLKVDSGMHRNGIMIEQMEEAFIMIEKQGLVLEGVMTHFRSADELNAELFWQMQVWKDIKEKSLMLVKKYGWQVPLFHSANSATLLRLENYHDDFARCGIATYGYDDFSQTPLKPLLTLWAEKIATRTLKKGQAVGYGGVGVCSHDMAVTTYDVGYADGFFRYNGEGDLRTAAGLKILGRVSMDNISIEGEAGAVALFCDARALAEYHDTIVYDIVVKLSPLLKRVLI
jgi:alanine racemase